MLSALGVVPFRRFWTTVVLAMLGYAIQTFALGYYIVQLAVRAGTPELGSFYLGVVGVAQVIPSLLLGAFGGVLADRVDRRRTLVTTESVMLVSFVILTTLIVTDRFSIAAGAGLSMVQGTVFALGQPARQSLVPNLVPRERLVSAIGMNSAAYNATTFIGPLIAGVLFVPLGLNGLFWLTCVLEVAAVITLLLALPHLHVPRVAAVRSGVWRSLADGLAYAWRDRITRWTLILFGTAAFFVREYAALLPAVSERVLHVGAVELSWMLSASGAGALAGTITTATLAHVERRGRLLVICAASMGALLAALALQATLVGAIVFVAALAFTTLLFVGMTNTILQVRTPDAMRGRILSLPSLSYGVLGPVGLLTFGTLGTAIGIDRALLVGGILFVMVAAFAFLNAAELWRASVRPGMPKDVPEIVVAGD